MMEGGIIGRPYYASSLDRGIIVRSARFTTSSCFISTGTGNNEQESHSIWRYNGGFGCSQPTMVGGERKGA